MAVFGWVKGVLAIGIVVTVCCDVSPYVTLGKTAVMAELMHEGNVVAIVVCYQVFKYLLIQKITTALNTVRGSVQCRKEPTGTSIQM